MYVFSSDAKNNTNELLALSAINNNKRVTTTVMNKEKESIPFVFDNGIDSKTILMPPRSIITIINE